MMAGPVGIVTPDLAASLRKPGHAIALNTAQLWARRDRTRYEVRKADTATYGRAWCIFYTDRPSPAERACEPCS